MLRKIALAAGAGGLLLALIGTPVAANEVATLRHLNGLPGVRLDICLVGQGETVSGLRYGRFATRPDVPAATYKVQARIAATGVCTGRRLLVRDVVLEAGKDYTLVYWKPSRAVGLSVFENDLSLLEADAAILTMRHTASAGRADIWVWKHARAAGLFDPTFDDLGKGGESPRLALDAGQVLIDAFPATERSSWTYRYFWTHFDAAMVYEAYLIGTEKKNHRIAVLGQAGTFTP